MGDTTKISWAQRTWNPWIGCTKVSTGCQKCYMYRLEERFGRDPAIVRRTSEAIWQNPRRWNKAAVTAGEQQLVFTCSMSDFFHANADEWRADAWDIIKSTPALTYQILTKRPERIAEHLPSDWGLGYPNVWLGTSVENQRYADQRVPILLTLPAAVHFLSCEPMLGPINLRELDYAGGTRIDALRGIFVTPDGTGQSRRVAWVICGGESGRDFRPMMLEWAKDLKAQCDEAGVPFFGKQRAGPVNELPLIIDGRRWHAMPRGFAAPKMEIEPRWAF